jgi:hypothetical protein
MDSPSGPPSSSGALDEFAVEDLNSVSSNSTPATENVLFFECEAQPEPAVPVSGFEVKRRNRSGRASAAHRLAIRMQRRTAASRARMMSERETIRLHAHRAFVAVGIALAELARRSVEMAVQLWEYSLPLLREGRGAANRSASLAWSRSIAAAKVAAALGERAWASGSRTWPPTSPAFARPVPETAFEHQEFNGSVVAVVLAAVVIGYGGLMAASWRTPTDLRVARVTAPREADEAPVVRALATPVTADRQLVQPSVVQPSVVQASVVRASAVQAPAVQASVTTRPAAARRIATDVGRRAFTPNARTLTALWQRRDTRSLDRAFATLRLETLALRSCGMRVTDSDRAVARCEGVTIDFRRTGGRWLIARVTKG